MTGSFSAVSASGPFRSPLSVRAEAYNSSSATVQYWSIHYSDNAMLLELFVFMTHYTAPSHTLPCSPVLHRHTLFYALFNDSRRPVSHLQLYIGWFTFTGSSCRRQNKSVKPYIAYWVTGQRVTYCILPYFDHWNCHYGHCYAGPYTPN